MWYISMNDCDVFESDGLVRGYGCDLKLMVSSHSKPAKLRRRRLGRLGKCWYL